MEHDAMDLYSVHIPITGTRVPGMTGYTTSIPRWVYKGQWRFQHRFGVLWTSGLQSWLVGLMARNVIFEIIWRAGLVTMVYMLVCTSMYVQPVPLVVSNATHMRAPNSSIQEKVTKREEDEQTSSVIFECGKKRQGTHASPNHFLCPSCYGYR